MPTEYLRLCQDYNDLFKDHDMDFINIGYYPINKILNEKNNSLNFNASLYLYALKNIKTQNKNILDLGCGRGGGTRIYKKYFDFNRVYGLDFNEYSINYCKTKNNNIEYSFQSLNNFSYSFQFDIITMIESTWKINNYDTFSDSIKKYLSSDGVFVCLDFFTQEHNNNFIKFTNQFNFVKTIDITENAIKACKMQMDELKNNSDEISKFLLYKHIDNYEAFKDKNSKYLKYICSDKEIK